MGEGALHCSPMAECKQERPVYSVVGVGYPSPLCLYFFQGGDVRLTGWWISGAINGADWMAFAPMSEESEDVLPPCSGWLVARVGTSTGVDKGWQCVAVGAASPANPANPTNSAWPAQGDGACASGPSGPTNPANPPDQGEGACASGPSGSRVIQARAENIPLDAEKALEALAIAGSSADRCGYIVCPAGTQVLDPMNFGWASGGVPVALTQKGAYTKFFLSVDNKGAAMEALQSNAYQCLRVEVPHSGNVKKTRADGVNGFRVYGLVCVVGTDVAAAGADVG
jgi:hypothetical protein